MNELIEVEKWPEWCDGEDWKRVYQADLAESMPWDPICVLPPRVVACWIFSEDTVLFVCGHSVGRVQLSNDRLEAKIFGQGLFFKLCKTIHKVCTMPEQTFSIVADEFRRQKVQVALSVSEEERLSWMSTHCRVVSLVDGNKRIVACLPFEGKVFGTSAELNAGRLLTELALNFSRYLMKNPTALVVPKCFFEVSNAPDDLLLKFWSPKVYRPGTQCGCWIWPWQRFSADAHYSSDALLTTTLCADIRLSTSAMDRTLDKVDFAIFIRDAVRVMKDALRENGGFFDKETGDGVVGHFIDGVMSRNGAVSAYRASCKMVEEVTRICNDFVEKSLSQLLPVGIGVGIHTGEAHWFASGNQVNAIGSSVVDATRICERAQAGEILMSLGAHRNLKECSSGMHASFRQIRDIEFKGMNAPIGAYSMKV